MTDKKLLKELLRLHEMELELIGWCVSWKFPAVRHQMEKECQRSFQWRKEIIELHAAGDTKLAKIREQMILKQQRAIVAVPHEARKLTSRYIRVMANRKAKVKLQATAQ